MLNPVKPNSNKDVVISSMLNDAETMELKSNDDVERVKRLLNLCVTAMSDEPTNIIGSTTEIGHYNNNFVKTAIAEIASHLDSLTKQIDTAQNTMSILSRIDAIQTSIGADGDEEAPLSATAKDRRQPKGERG